MPDDGIVHSGVTSHDSGKVCIQHGIFTYHVLSLIHIYKDGILWLASTSSGVYRLNFPKKQFQLLTEVSPSPVVPERSTSWNQGIRALFQAQNGDIWVGTRWQALYRLDRNGQVKQIFSDKNYLLGAVYHIMEDKDLSLIHILYVSAYHPILSKTLKIFVRS